MYDSVLSGLRRTEYGVATLYIYSVVPYGSERFARIIYELLFVYYVSCVFVYNCEFSQVQSCSVVFYII